MKKIIFTIAAFAAALTVQAQGIDFGIKAGANFANFNGDIDSEGITSFHAGGVLEINVVPSFSVQAEALFSSQGGEALYEDEGGIGVARDINLDYISVPVLAKFYLLPDRLSITVGPQFSFLVDEAEEAFEAKSFDLAASGGAELKIIAGLFAQARYNIGLTETFDNIDAKNAVFQLSVGYMF